MQRLTALCGRGVDHGPSSSKGEARAAQTMILETLPEVLNGSTRFCPQHDDSGIDVGPLLRIGFPRWSPTSNCKINQVL